MTHATYELTPDASQPVELYDFTIPGTVLAWHYTTDTYAATFDGVEYLPEAITRSDIKRTLSEPSSEVTIEVGDENTFALRLMAGLTARPVEVRIRQYHRGDDERINVFTGYAAGVSFDGAKATITCLPRLAVASRRQVPWQTYQAGCNWQWGSPGCGVNKAAFLRGVFTYLSAPPASLLPGVAYSSGTTMVIGGSHADGDLSNGYVERAVDGDTRFIEENVGGTLTLQSPFTGLVPGESLRVYPGCRRTEEDCEKRFNNLVHFLGWPRLPTLNPFDRSAFYLAGNVAPVTDAPGVAVAPVAPGGVQYTVSLAEQKVRNVTGAISITFTTDGFVRVNGVTVPVMYITPRPAPVSVAAGMDVFVSSEGLIGAPSAGSVVAVTPIYNFDQWLPLTENRIILFNTRTTELQNADGYGTVTFGTIKRLQVKMRNSTTGVIVAQGYINIGFTGTSRSLRNGTEGTRFPSGW